MMIITTIRYYNGTINWWQFEQIYLDELGHNYRSKRTNHRNTHINHTKIKTEPQTYTLTHSGTFHTVIECRLIQQLQMRVPYKMLCKRSQ